MFRRRTTNLVSMVIAILAIADGFGIHCRERLRRTRRQSTRVPHPERVGRARHQHALHAARQRRDGRHRHLRRVGDLTHGVPVEHGFVGFAMAGIPGPTVDCGAGVYDGTTATTFTCDVTGLAQQVATIQATDIDVSN